MEASMQSSDTTKTSTSWSQPILGVSPQIRGVIDQINRVGPTDASVLVIGESGSGKELVARSIHDRSQRIGKPFIAINCGAVAGNLIETEIFGHEKGSFTGAVRSHEGVFERANGGTLFLDEVTEMPCELQVRLLRVLENRRFFRVGGTQEIVVDVRVIAATNCCPLAAVRDRKLREDVLYRLAAFPIDVPPLRQRGHDVELLARHILDTLNEKARTRKQFSAEAIRTLYRHSWPGNVRELRNAVERAHILADDNVEIAPLVMNGEAAAPVTNALQVPVGSRLEQVERALIEATLQHFEGNKRQAAEVLGCSLKTLYNKLNGYSRAPQFAQS
jgi:DNA-binding NtrC family response regulator